MQIFSDIFISFCLFCKTGVITYNVDRSTPAPFDGSSECSDLDQPTPSEPYSMPPEVDGHVADNPLMSSLMPGPPPQGVQLMPPGVHECVFVYKDLRL